MRCTFLSCVRRISSALTVGWNGLDSGGGRQIHFAHEDRAIALNVCALRNAQHLGRILRPQPG